MSYEMWSREVEQEEEEDSQHECHEEPQQPRRHRRNQWRRRLWGHQLENAQENGDHGNFSNQGTYPRARNFPPKKLSTKAWRRIWIQRQQQKFAEIEEQAVAEARKAMEELSLSRQHG